MFRHDPKILRLEFILGVKRHPLNHKIEHNERRVQRERESESERASDRVRERLRMGERRSKENVSLSHLPHVAHCSRQETIAIQQFHIDLGECGPTRSTGWSSLPLSLSLSSSLAHVNIYFKMSTAAKSLTAQAMHLRQACIVVI